MLYVMEEEVAVAAAAAATPDPHDDDNSPRHCTTPFVSLREALALTQSLHGGGGSIHNCSVLVVMYCTVVRRMLLTVVALTTVRYSEYIAK